MFNQIKEIENFQLLKDKVYQAIKKEIIELNFQPGEQLIEQSVADRLGVSKSPVRDAFQHLKGDGFVCASPYRSNYVSPLSIQEFKNILQMRRGIELFCLRETFNSYTSEDIEKFRRITAMSVKCMKRGDESIARENHLKIHQLIVNKLGNELIDNVYTNISDKMRRYLNSAQKNIPDIIMISNMEHQKLFNAIKKRDQVSASQILEKHLSGLVQKYLASDTIKAYHGSQVYSE